MTQMLKTSPTPMKTHFEFSMKKSPHLCFQDLRLLELLKPQFELWVGNPPKV
jgi:hypothetical protein